MAASGISQYQLSFEISPILLKNGIATDSVGGMMPITDIIQIQTKAPTSNLLSQLFTTNANGGHFAIFENLPNGTLADWKIADYPFASLVMAANAVVQSQLKISMKMTCPAQTDSARNFFARSTILTTLQSQIQSHVLLGGTFVVITPAYTYNDVLLTSIRDITPPSESQKQSIWQWDFEQPLITSTGAEQALGTFMDKAEKGLPTPVTWDSPS